MVAARQIFVITFFIGTTCLGVFWNRNDTRVINPVLPAGPIVPDANAMVANCTVNVNYSPVQVKTSFEIPDKFLSNLSIKEWQSKTSTFLYNKRYFIGASIILGSYVLICNYFVQGSKYLGRTDTWASWRMDTPVDLLIAIPQPELGKELILEIQRRYSNVQNPTDFISPLITFIQTIDVEIVRIKQYALVYQWIKKLHLQNVFPLNQKQFNMLDEKYNKLIYLKNTFLSWVAEYKINHNKNKRSMPEYKKTPAI